MMLAELHFFFGAFGKIATTQCGTRKLHQQITSDRMRFIFGCHGRLRSIFLATVMSSNRSRV
jgi:hypothetical protein